MEEALKTRHSVGAYKREELWKVMSQARYKEIPFETIDGPKDNFQLEDGTKITVAEGMTAVVLITTDLTIVNDFWTGFEYPDKSPQYP